jgi:hypothetical protein
MIPCSVFSSPSLAWNTFFPRSWSHLAGCPLVILATLILPLAILPGILDWMRWVHPRGSGWVLRPAMERVEGMLVDTHALALLLFLGANCQRCQRLPDGTGSEQARNTGSMLVSSRYRCRARPQGMIRSFIPFPVASETSWTF